MEKLLKEIYEKYLFKENININCFSKLSEKMVLYPHQLRVKDYFKESSKLELPQRGLLLFHGLGSGKTITSIVSAFNEKSDIIILTPASLKQNYKNEIDKVIEKKSKSKFKLYSYNTSKIVKDLGKISLKDKIVIVDEAHNLFSMITSNSKIGQYIYKRFIDGVNTRFLFLSGTPIINTPYEIALMFNVLRPGIFPINVMSKDNFELYYVIQKQNRNDIKKLIYGLSSYFEGVNDKNIFPSSHRKIIKVPMTNIQKQQYKQYDKIERMPFFLKNNKSYKEDKSKNIQNMYKVYTRQVCNFPYIKESQLKSIKDSELTYNLYKYSIKYSKLINIVKRSPGPVLIYSNFKETGINLIARILDLNGITYIKWTSDESEKERELNLKNFNDKTNKHGNKIKCILITSAGAEGISLKNVRQVHIMEPHWNKNRESQVIGRAMRICSHSDLPVKERHIDIYNYYSIWDNNNIITADVVIHNLAENKYKIIKEFLELIKESAFDCEFSKEKLNCYFKVI